MGEEQTDKYMLPERHRTTADYSHLAQIARPLTDSILDGAELVVAHIPEQRHKHSLLQCGFNVMMNSGFMLRHKGAVVWKLG